MVHAGKADGEPVGEGAAVQGSGQRTSKTDPIPKAKKKKDSKKDDVPPIEATPPPGPLVALGQPRQKLHKRPLDVALGSAGAGSLAKKPLPSPTTSGKGNGRTHLHTHCRTPRLCCTSPYCTFAAHCNAVLHRYEHCSGCTYVQHVGQ